jgi:predicted nuclease with TOPRIM domain
LENSELRKRIEVINKRLEEHNRENLNLAKQNDTVDMKIEQAKDEMQRLKGSLRKKEEELYARTR